MPSFLKDLRRRSRASFRHDAPSKKPNGSSESMPTTKSSSTLDSTSNAEASTAPTSHPPSLSNLMITKPDVTNSQTSQQRPSPVSLQGSTMSKRSSMVGSFSGTMQPSPKVPQSLYAPRILSISEGSLVHQKAVLLYGTCGQDQKLLDGTITVTHHQEKFPVMKWPVCASHFKALVHLSPGWNELRLEFSSPKLVSYGGSSTLHISSFRLNYLPLTNSPPLHLALILGSDSPGTFDSTPEKIQTEGNDLQVAIRKYRMTGILWQAYMAEMMSRNGFGRRSFRFEEEWQTASLSRQERETHEMRNEVKVHVVRSKRTMAEWRDLNVAQQYDKATRKGDLFGYAADDLKDYFKPVEGQAYQVAAMVLDTHWDTRARVIRGHAAVGGDGGGIHLGLFGSHALHAYPTCIEDVVPALTDGSKISRDFIGVEGHDDVGMACWAAASSLGAHLHEVGHLFGCPHQSHGIMAWDYEKIARTFLVREPYSPARKQAGLAPCLPEHEIGWHRLDMLRFRSHPCFRLVGDAPMRDEGGVQVWPTEDELIVTARSGIAFIEIHPAGEGFCNHFFEFAETANGFLRQVTLTKAKIQRQLPPELRNRTVGIKVFSHGGGDYFVPDIAKALTKISIPKGRVGFLGPKYGQSAMPDSRPLELLFDHAVAKTTRFLRAVRVYHEPAVHGLDFLYDDGSAQLFGKRGGNQTSEFGLDTRRGEALSGFFVRAGFWIDGIEILTNLGRRSGVYGNRKGGTGVTLIPPRGFRMAGLRGSAGAWLDGFSLIITV